MSRHARQNDDRRCWLRLCLPAAVAVAALLSLAVAEPEGGATTRPASDVPDRVMAELRAANAARSQLLQAEQDWALEKEKLKLLKSTVLREAARLRAAADEAARQETNLGKRTTGARAQRKRLDEVEAMVDALAERLEKALEATGRRYLPGLVPADRAAGITDPAERLSAAAGRLAEARRQAGAARIELVSGFLAGRALTVKLLRAGGVAAWWMSLDGADSGPATLADGKLLLTAARTAGDDEAIRKAFAIAEGHAPPAWSLLPADHVKVTPQAGGKP